MDRSGLRPLWLGLGALVSLFLLAPVGIGLGVAAVWLGVRARRRASGPVPGAVPGLVMGAVAVVLGAITLGTQAYLWPELSGFQKCLTTANTNTDEEACRDTWLPKMDRKLGVPEGSFEKFSVF